jgi:hypothetical protein
MSTSNRYRAVGARAASPGSRAIAWQPRPALSSRALIARAALAPTLCWLSLGLMVLALPSGVAPVMALPEAFAPAFVAPPPKPTLIEIPSNPLMPVDVPAVRSGAQQATP